MHVFVVFPKCVCVLFTGAGYRLKFFCTSADTIRAELLVAKVGLRPPGAAKVTVFLHVNWFLIFIHIYLCIKIWLIANVWLNFHCSCTLTYKYCKVVFKLVAQLHKNCVWIRVSCWETGFLRTHVQHISHFLRNIWIYEKQLCSRCKLNRLIGTKYMYHYRNTQVLYVLMCGCDYQSRQECKTQQWWLHLAHHIHLL